MKINELNFYNVDIQNIINYDTADRAFKEAINCYNEYELNKNDINTNYESGEDAAFYYSTIQYCIQRFTQALEGYFKAISISNGKTWPDNRRMGHSLFDLYNNIIPNDIKYIVDVLFLYSDKYVEQVLNLKMHYINYAGYDGPFQSIMLLFLEKKLKDLSENRSESRQHANVASRFPGEKYTEYDIDFLYSFSKIISIISFKFRKESKVLGINVEEKQKEYVYDELTKIFKKIDIHLMDYDPEFINYIQERIDTNYSTEHVERKN